MIPLKMLFWAASSIKRWSWSYGLGHIYMYVWTNFDDVCCWRMCWLLIENCCCFWSNSRRTVSCREIRVNVFRWCRLYVVAVYWLSTCRLEWYMKIVCWKVELLFVLTAFDCVQLLLLWINFNIGLLANVKILNDYWKCCCCWSAPWKFLVDKLMLPVFHTLPKPTIALYLFLTFYQFFPKL